MECQKNKKIPPKFMPTHQTFVTCIFQSPSWFPPEYLVDKYSTIRTWILSGVRILLIGYCILFAI